MTFHVLVEYVYRCYWPPQKLLLRSLYWFVNPPNVLIFIFGLFFFLVPDRSEMFRMKINEVSAAKTVKLIKGVKGKDTVVREGIIVWNILWTSSATEHEMSPRCHWCDVKDPDVDKSGITQNTCRSFHGTRAIWLLLQPQKRTAACHSRKLLITYERFRPVLI